MSLYLFIFVSAFANSIQFSPYVGGDAGLQIARSTFWVQKATKTQLRYLSTKKKRQFDLKCKKKREKKKRMHVIPSIAFVVCLNVNLGPALPCNLQFFVPQFGPFFSFPLRQLQFFIARNFHEGIRYNLMSRPDIKRSGILSCEALKELEE